MKRKVFYSFHFDGDFWRTQTVRNIGAIEADEPVTKNEWEEVKGGGEAAIKAWISEQLTGKTCLICLVGAQTAERPWVIHEIREAWNSGKGVVAIGIDRLKDNAGNQSTRGLDPFDRLVFVDKPEVKLSDAAKTYYPSHAASKDAYQWITENIEAAVEEAIRIRSEFKL